MARIEPKLLALPLLALCACITAIPARESGSGILLEGSVLDTFRHREEHLEYDGRSL
jgi:hypothetical protein